ncbi:imidazole glycerol phosphate synthase subunit HisH [Brevibacillus borstelensis]|uniref:imidazole glycerol phosphate synthase subunit HisH n=1 Tax=Brevibacillus borstelensis TaxID=45462 RepID=UPI000F07585D|nr:imidazole glycerol phosphate synthase subunit HisH [Brevibacillus borstelensis]MBE5396858.1 imidazole glycerol phosphate synthase subunit HisH [Brevibacillus borstelensis]MCM3625009.1 imidazole glycerol phosphate synthase subunit HisH [Brevibacillus borstelensis]MED1873753.1 imidazole glycerol phosphate synthase subunit HisH [Brevibacillus borstelensis]MED1881279.1 imidazole glycerol phosphate synthase subunit HisH [Brevibacillus borstelensis]RNB57133.1 imidazole glycerol phosphate synthase
MIGIIDYGMGNLYSLGKALERLGCSYEFVSRPERLEGLSGAILPGVGAFGDAMKNIRELELEEGIRSYAASGRPILGICLGMQLLFEQSTEHGVAAGLGLIGGKAVRFEGDYKVPHMGWNQLHMRAEHPLLSGVKSGDYVYFVHSYHVRVSDEKVLLATTEYHQQVTAIVGQDQVYGMQFHPEKSGETGMRLLANFAELCKGEKA